MTAFNEKEILHGRSRGELIPCNVFVWWKRRVWLRLPCLVKLGSGMGQHASANNVTRILRNKLTCSDACSSPNPFATFVIADKRC